MKQAYVQAISLIERLNRRLLDLVKDEFDRMDWSDINPTQALLLFHMGKQEVRAGDFRRRGYYLGSNASYNLMKLEALGYLMRTQGVVDRRIVKVKLTGKGEEVAEVVEELFQRHLHPSGEVTSDLDEQLLSKLTTSMAAFERFWITRAGMAALPKPRTQRKVA